MGTALQSQENIPQYYVHQSNEVSTLTARKKVFKEDPPQCRVAPANGQRASHHEGTISSFCGCTTSVITVVAKREEFAGGGAGEGVAINNLGTFLVLHRVATDRLRIWSGNE